MMYSHLCIAFLGSNWPLSLPLGAWEDLAPGMGEYKSVMCSKPFSLSEFKGKVTAVPVPRDSTDNSKILPHMRKDPY